MPSETSSRSATSEPRLASAIAALTSSIAAGPPCTATSAAVNTARPTKRITTVTTEMATMLRIRPIGP